MTTRRRPDSIYERNLSVPGWGPEGQEKLAEATVFVAGLGGLGCPASVYLAAAGVGNLIVCDADDVEQSNLNRQFLYRPTDIGQSKAVLAADRLQKAHRQIEIVPAPLEIDLENAEAMIGDADIVLDCLDNLQTRLVLSRACMRERIPLVHATVAELTGYLSFFNPPDTPCLECFQTDKPASVEPAIPGFTAGVMGSLQAMEAVKYLLGIGELLAGRVLVFEGIPPRVDVVSFERDAECPACGKLQR